MDRIITADELTTFSFHQGEVECIRFEQCDLSGRDLSHVVFIECDFRDCNLSNASLKGASFRECSFHSCKLTGLRFDDCFPFLQPPLFENCDLTLASFVSMKMPSVHFTQCRLQETDFSQSVLIGAVFAECNLEGAIFESTDLSKANIETSYNYSIDPERNKVKQLTVSGDNLSGFLDKYKMIIK